MFFWKEAESKRKYAYASSLIRTQYLSRNIVEELERGEKGIGEIIEEYKVETYREFIEQKTSSGCLLQSMFSTNGQVSIRVYKIYIQSNPVMLITEYYPDEMYNV